MSDKNMLGESQEDFLQRVRGVLGREAEVNADEVVAPEVDERLMRLADAGEDLVARFIAGATATGMKARVCDRDEFSEVLKGILSQCSAKKVVVSGDQACEQLEVRQCIAEVGAAVFEPTDEANFEGQYDAEVGVTGVVAGLAETGTLVIESGTGQSRGVSLVPGVHVAVVRESDVLADMIDYLARYKGTRGESQPSSKVFITGPSKTADIEGVLITGVHGPAVVEIVVVRGV